MRAALLAAALLASGAAAAEPALPPASAPSSSPARAEAAVDLNRATAAELCTLPGIGPKKAEAILALRARRPFTRVTQLLEVKGIGRRTFERLRSRVTVEPPSQG